MGERLFVYGTLKNAKVQKEVFGRTDKGVPDILEGYKKSEIVLGGETYPIIIPDTNSSVEGLVISVTQEELKLIDGYETDAYKRKRVILRSGETAWTYQK